ncbi:hypothetical protein DM860_014575 [Cuscuta australis]|uniref:Uncharacterized protein n=1 Tax=Cuscuta australis TaxID=267555 RepID=A0A328DH45_9ASTE|nr:hypothetical protein DM860_014575 [Cuscuta australis]
MGILDAGVRIAARFNSHCPQTSRMYYHPPPPPPPPKQDDSANRRPDAGDASGKNCAAAGTLFSKAAAGIDPAHFILYTV